MARTLSLRTDAKTPVEPLFPDCCPMMCEYEPPGGDDAPVTLAIQPHPINVVVMHGQGTTTIARLWADGDSQRCRLCPRDKCGVTSQGLCLVKLPRHVADKDASLAPWDAPSPHAVTYR